MWQKNQNSGYSTGDDPFGVNAGTFAQAATQKPGGSDPANKVSYVNSSPWSATNNTSSLNQYHPKHLYGRRGRTQGGQGAGGGGSTSGVQGGGFNKLSGGNISTGTIGGGVSSGGRGMGLFSGGQGT